MLAITNAIALFPSPDHAHHPWEAATDNINILQGFLSGVAHTIIGLDHLLFLVSIGFVARMSSISWAPYLLFSRLIGSLTSQIMLWMPGV